MRASIVSGSSKPNVREEFIKDCEGRSKFFYHKQSMTPTFTPGDLLTVAPYENRPIRVGDIVVFRPPDRNEHTTHRVVRVRSDGIVTCGDNVRNPVDPWMLRPCDIVGYVTHAERGKKVRIIAGGRIGLIRHLVHRRMTRTTLRFRRAIHLACQTLRFDQVLRSIDLRFLLPRRYRPRALCLRRNSSTELLLLMGRMVVGRHIPGSHYWSVRFWCLPFVNVKFLKAAVKKSEEF